MVLLDEEAQVEARFSLIVDSPNPDARYMHGLRRTYHMLGSRFGRTRWNCKGTWVMCNLVSICLEIVLVSMQDRCSDCVKRTIG